ncbi:sugar-binding transcriptional regulator [Bradyrhizobium iriomotense]|uniref:Transcriptional regulator n=1 Tax=Bradyrhizobium iriomotense TaxID=441950 RepID=A0ABQ6B7D4_9BRAD|nr:sugar-binding transcriptional regulator [Bradyrhizobium iriomotense]GLR90290.1 transcriptional regulator [Bradyrhizobium iriomotense]
MTDNNDADGSFDAALAARICWHYFKEGQTQELIAQQLNLTRKRVNRMLAEARERGLVQITIQRPLGPCSELESRLTKMFELRHAIVVPSPIGNTDVRVLVGAAAGDYISDHLTPGGALGIAWGGTINAAAQNVRRRSGEANRVVLLCGGLAESTSINPYDNASMMARALDARCYYITAPMFAASPELRDLLLASEPVRSVLAMVSKLDLALLSAVDLTDQSRALEYGVITRNDWRSLRAAGAVGDICGHYLDADGNVIEHSLTTRVINPSVKSLQAIPLRVLAAGGASKVAIVRAAIRARLCNALITDESAATALVRS